MGFRGAAIAERVRVLFEVAGGNKGLGPMAGEDEVQE